MKDTIKTLSFTVLVLSSIASKAQQQPNFLFFEQNMSLFNPAYTGSEGSLAGLQYRSAWSGIEDAPRAASFIYHTKEKNKASWGISYLTDRVYVENQGIVDFFLISNEPTTEVKKTIAITPGEWNSIDIPLSEFSPVELNKVFQFKIVGAGTIFFDNFYFKK